MLVAAHQASRAAAMVIDVMGSSLRTEVGCGSGPPQEERTTTARFTPRHAAGQLSTEPSRFTRTRHSLQHASAVSSLGMVGNENAVPPPSMTAPDDGPPTPPAMPSSPASVAVAARPFGMESRRGRAKQVYNNNIRQVVGCVAVRGSEVLLVSRCVPVLITLRGGNARRDRSLTPPRPRLPRFTLVRCACPAAASASGSCPRAAGRATRRRKSRPRARPGRKAA